MLWLETDQLLELLVIGGFAHVLLIAGSLRWNVLAILAAAFLIVAPFTAALDAKAIIASLKWGRVYISCLMTFLGLLFVLNRGTWGPCTKGFLAFWTLLTVASLWSDYPADAFNYKVMSATTFLGGIFLGLSVKDLYQLRQTLRLLACPSILWAGLLLWQILDTPGKLGRLDAFGMNPNMIGGLCAICFCLPAALALHSRGKARLFWGAIAATHVVLVLMTGSRASFGALVVAGGCLFFPVLRRPAVAAVWLALLGGIAVLMLSHIDSDSASRMSDLSNTREAVWSVVWNRAVQTPILGQGAWMDARRGRVAWGNTHSMYLQVFYEIGLVGIGVFFVFMFVQARRSIFCLRTLDVPEKWLIPAFFAIPLGIGLFESGPILGASSLAMFWGISIGLADRLPTIAQNPLLAPSSGELRSLFPQASYA